MYYITNNNTKQHIRTSYVKIQPENECIEYEYIEWLLSFVLSRNSVYVLKFDSTGVGGRAQHISVI